MKRPSSCYTGCIVLAATLARRASCQNAQTPGVATENAGGITSAPTRMTRNLQDIPVVGVTFGPTPNGDSLTVPSSSSTTSMVSVVADELIRALEQDDQVTGEIVYMLHQLTLVGTVAARDYIAVFFVAGTTLFPSAPIALGLLS